MWNVVMEDPRHRISGIDYPGTFQDFDNRVSSENACLENIAKLHYYLDEFTLGFNRRTSKARGLLFYRLIEQAIDCRPAPSKMIIGGQTQHRVDS